MAGKYIEFVNPGYSTLYTRDLKYAPATARDGGGSNPDVEDSALNVFNPDSAAPLLEGEFLQLVAGNKVTRGGEAAITPGNQDKTNVGSSPAWLHFHERGRYDAQITKKAHLVTGPAGFEFQTSLCYCEAGDEGEPVFVMDVTSPLDSSKTVRGLVTLGALKQNGGSTITLSAGEKYWAVGICTRVITAQQVSATAGSLGKMVVQYMPHYYQDA